MPDPSVGAVGARRPGRLTLDIRQHQSLRLRTAALAVGVATGLLLSAIILVAAGVGPDELLDEFILQTLFDGQNLRAVLFQSAPLVFVGLAASLAFRARFWNLGLEGQMTFGAIAATAISLFQIGPEETRLPVMFAAAALAGMAWVAIPLTLRLRFGVNEIIATLLLNYVALNFLLHLLYGAWSDPKDSFPHSAQFRAFERLPELGAGIGSAIPLALVAMVAAHWVLSISRAGFYLRFVDANPRMAEAVGVPTRQVTLLAVLSSGALAGGAGFVIAAGQEGRLTQSFSEGYGFSGVLIAFLARNNPLAAGIVAFLFATLFITGQSLQVFYQIPFSMVRVIEAILVISVAGSEFAIRHRVRWTR